METSVVPSTQLPPSQFEQNTENIKRKLLRQGVYPTPKIVRTLRKREIQKHNRKAKKSQPETPQHTAPELQSLAEESHFLTLKREYKRFSKALDPKKEPRRTSSLVGKPWERIKTAKLAELVSETGEFDGEGLKTENLVELREMFEEDLRWLLDDDVEVEEDEWLSSSGKLERDWDPSKRWRNQKEAIRFLVDRLSEREITERHWKFVRIMKQSGLQFTEWQLLRIVEGLGKKGKWRQAMAVVQWLYGNKERTDFKSRFVYTKLLSVLGKARRPREALRIFNLMLGDCHIYPDLAAYHTIAVTMGQAGLLKELLKIIECMRQKPKRIKNMRRKNWDPVLEPDLVVYNAVLNACVPLQQWKGVSWVFEQMRKSGLRPNGATYGLAMEVMLQSGKYDLVHEFFRKMKRSSEAPRALTYRVLVKAFWEEGKIDAAVEAVRDMEQRGVIGTASVYYELACCLCRNGRWQDAIIEVDKMKKLSHKKPMEITFTGLIMASLDGGHVDDCISIFEFMKDHCAPNIGTINAMLKVYGRYDMFSKAKELFEEVNKAKSGPYSSVNGKFTDLIPDGYTYSLMLEASASALQWEYFEYVYKEMALSGHHLDQNKHASLLVEASRAGKWYLLEHAFDTCLEGGEIPHLPFFTEMLIQATIRCNYERAATLVNTMAYAPFQVSEEQWTELFKENGDRIAEGSLERLLDALSSCELSSEITVSNLLRSLQSLFGSAESTSHSSLSSEVSGILEPQSNNRANAAMDAPVKATDGVGEADSVHSLSSYDAEDSIASTLTSIGDLEEYVKDVDEAENDLPIDDDELDFVINEDGGDSHTPKLPCAHDILESWKESRKNDGIFSLHLSQK